MNDYQCTAGLLINHESGPGLLYGHVVVLILEWRHCQRIGAAPIMVPPPMLEQWVVVCQFSDVRQQG